MTKTFTQDDVIRYLYNEVDESEQQQIQNTLLCNQELLNFYREAKDVQEDLNKVSYAPSDRSVQNVLDYSISFNLHTVK